MIALLVKQLLVVNKVLIFVREMLFIFQMIYISVTFTLELYIILYVMFKGINTYTKYV